jgi:hypothetical protein
MPLHTGLIGRHTGSAALDHGMGRLCFSLRHPLPAGPPCSASARNRPICEIERDVLGSAHDRSNLDLLRLPSDWLPKPELAIRHVPHLRSTPPWLEPAAGNPKFPNRGVRSLGSRAAVLVSNMLSSSTSKGGPSASPRARKQCRPGPQGAEEEAPARRRLSRDEAAALLRKAIRAARKREGRGHPQGEKSSAQAGSARRLDHSKAAHQEAGSRAAIVPALAYFGRRARQKSDATSAYEP